MNSKKFIFFALTAFLVLVLSSAALAGPHINIEWLSFHISGNKLLFETNIINDGDEDCTLTKVEFQDFAVWEGQNKININVWPNTGLDIYIKADHYVHYTFSLDLGQNVGFDFYSPSRNYKYTCAFKREAGDSDEEDDDDDEDGDDDSDDDAF